MIAVEAERQEAFAIRDQLREDLAEIVAEAQQLREQRDGVMVEIEAAENVEPDTQTFAYCMNNY